MFFLLASAPGFWFPALANILIKNDLEWTKATAFMIPAIAGMLSPLVMGAQVDKRFEAQKVLGWIMFLGSGFLFLAFHAIEQGWGGWWFLTFLSINALISAPAWSVLNTITLSSLENPEKSFGCFRVWGTIGWAVAGVIVSWLAFDFSPKAGKVAAFVRLAAGVACFMLPVTKPKGEKSKVWWENLGLGAIGLLKDRDLFYYFLSALLFSIPLGAFYLHTPEHLKELGVVATSRTMTSAQVVETIAMLFMGLIITKYRVKTVLMVAIICGVLRYWLYAFDSVMWMVIGIGLHGICWTLYFEAGRVFVHRRVDEGMRGQAQALLGFVSGGLGGVLGVLVVDLLHGLIVGSFGWSAYWMTLTGMNVVALCIFAVGYRGIDARSS